MPLNDDWQFALSAREFAENARLRILPYSAMTLVGQAVIGAAAWVIAPGFVSLRFVTLLLWMGIGPVVFWMARELGRDRRAAALAASTVLVCPLVILLGVTFMTDVPFLAAWCVSAACFVRALRRDSPAFAAAGALAAAFAASIRQPGALLPVAFVLALPFVANPRKIRHLLAMTVTGLPAFAVVCVAYLSASGGTQAFRQKLLGPPGESITRLPGGIWAAGCYLGLFLAPVLCLAPLQRGRRWWRLALLTAATALFAVQARWGLMPGCHKLFPLLPNVLHSAGLGTVTVLGAWDQGSALPRAPVWLLLAAGLGTAALAVRLLLSLREAWSREGQSAARLLPLLCSLYLAGTLATSQGRAPLFDRYLLPALPLLAVCLAPRFLPPKHRRLFAAGFGLLVFVAWSLVATRDYHRLNEARWDLCRVAESLGGSPRSIVGGFEYGGWHNGLDAFRESDSRIESWREWRVDEADYVVSFRPRDGYQVVCHRDVQLWLGLEGVQVLLLRRQPTAPSPSQVR